MEHTVVKTNLSQGFAGKECIVPNAPDTVRNGDFLHSGLSEAIVTNCA